MDNRELEQKVLAHYAIAVVGRPNIRDTKNLPVMHRLMFEGALLKPLAQTCSDCDRSVQARRAVYTLERNRRTLRHEGWSKQCSHCGRNWHVQQPFDKEKI